MSRQEEGNEELSLDQLKEVAGGNKKASESKSEAGTESSTPSSEQQPGQVTVPMQGVLTTSEGQPMQKSVTMQIKPGH